MDELNGGQVVKSGHTWFELTLGRDKQGIKVWIKTSPLVEEFMKSLGDGKSISARSYGPLWIPVKQLGLFGESIEVPLMVYNKTQDLSGSSNYRFDEVGEQLYPDPKYGMVNLSFLRIVGIGEGPGVSFIVRGAMSRDEVKKMAKDILDACRVFIKQYITPIGISLAISSQEV